MAGQVIPGEEMQMDKESGMVKLTNQRLIFVYDLLKKYTNIVCKYCNTILCSKSDAFSISKSFMNAFLNPGGVIHGNIFSNKF
jgi:hypothetical protein